MIIFCELAVPLISSLLSGQELLSGVAHYEEEHRLLSLERSQERPLPSSGKGLPVQRTRSNGPLVLLTEAILLFHC